MERKDLDLPRAVFHILFHVIALVLVVLLRVPDAVVDAILLIAAGLVALIDSFMIFGHRLCERGVRNQFTRAYKWFYVSIAHILIREKELGYPTAMTSYVVGLIFVRFVFRLSIVDSLAVMAILAWGDPFARIGGMTIKSPKLPKSSKSWAGLVSFILAAAIGVVITNVATTAAGMFHCTPQLGVAQYVAICAGALVEVYATRWDNFFIALVSALTFERVLFFLS